MFKSHHTSALKCAVPRRIARCIGGFGMLHSTDPGNDLTLMRISTLASIGECPTSGRKEKRREHDADELTLFRDGEEVFEATGNYSSVAESEPSYSFHDGVGY